MRMKQLLLFPSMTKEPRKLAKPVSPPNEERELLYYGRYIDSDTLVFIKKNRAEYNAEIHTAMARAEKAGLTWGELEKRYPQIWALMERLKLTTFENWVKKTKRDKSKKGRSGLQVVSSPRKEYMNLGKWDRMPLPEEPFDGQVILENYPLLGAPYDGSEGWIPTEITDEFGEVQEGFFVDPYVTFKEKDVKEVTKAFRKHGYRCRRNNRIVEKAMGIL